MFIYPVESQVVLENLRKKVSQLEAGMQIDAEKGRVRDPGKQAAMPTPKKCATNCKWRRAFFPLWALFHHVRVING